MRFGSRPMVIIEKCGNHQGSEMTVGATTAKNPVRFAGEGLNLQGKRVLVTGAASGIGQATARVFARLGADLTLTDIASLDETQAQIEEIGQNSASIQGDLTDDNFLKGLVEKAHPFAFAHCAAVFSRKTWRPDLTDKARFDLLMQVNVRAPMILASSCIESMADRGGGFIVLVGSAAGRNGGGIGGGTPIDYAASKGAVHTLVRSLSRLGVGRNVLVNGVAPGPVETPLARGLDFPPASLPLGRIGQPDELAWPIAFLCSPAASFISGAVLDVNGGAFVG